MATIQLYYSVPQDKLLRPEQVTKKTGIPVDSVYSEDSLLYQPTENIEALNRAQVYPLTDTADPYNPSLYTTVVSYVVSNYPNGAVTVTGVIGLPGDYATQSYTATARPLTTAKSNGKQDVRARASNNSAALRESSGYNADAISAAAAQLIADRGADVQATIALTDSVMAQADVNIQAVEAATSVSDVADIVDAPDLVVNTGRGLSSDLDMNPTYFPTINLGNVVESDLELYILAADTILDYRTDLPSPYHFDMGTQLFTDGDSRVKVRIAATGVCVGEFVCPDTGSGANVDVDIFTTTAGTSNY